MPAIRSFGSMTVLLLSLALTACGGGGGGGPDDPPQPAYDLYVDEAVGSDGNAGTAAAPFKTITTALSQAQPGMTVKVMPGTYDALNGETFPIQIPQGVVLLGDAALNGAGGTPTTIAGFGNIAESLAPSTTAAVKPSIDSAIQGFTVQNTGSAQDKDHVGILIASSGIAVLDNTIQHNEWAGIKFVGPTGDLVESNVIQNNGVGIDFTKGGEFADVRSNMVMSNTTGIWINRTGVDLGGGGLSTGHNVIASNVKQDLMVVDGVAVSARNNRWDHSNPTEGWSGVLGVDIRYQGGAPNVSSVDTTGAKQYVPVVLVPLTP